MVICVKVLTEDCKFLFTFTTYQKIRLKSLTKNSYFLENTPTHHSIKLAICYRMVCGVGVFWQRFEKNDRTRKFQKEKSRVFSEDLINLLKYFYVFISSILLNFRDNSGKINKMVNFREKMRNFLNFFFLNLFFANFAENNCPQLFLNSARHNKSHDTYFLLYDFNL